MNVNKAILVGRITNDLEMKTTQTGKEVLSFGLATNRTWKDQSGTKQESTNYHNIVAWGKTAQTIAQYCSKGQELYVEGRSETRSWEDDNGKKQYRTEVVVDQFQFGSSPKESSNETQNKGNSVDESKIDYPEEEINPDDIPF